VSELLLVTNFLRGGATTAAIVAVIMTYWTIISQIERQLSYLSSQKTTRLEPYGSNNLTTSDPSSNGTLPRQKERTQICQLDHGSTSLLSSPLESGVLWVISALSTLIVLEA
jgi:hypothetical protein